MARLNASDIDDLDALRREVVGNFLRNAGDTSSVDTKEPKQGRARAHQIKDSKEALAKAMRGSSAHLGAWVMTNERLVQDGMWTRGGAYTAQERREQILNGGLDEGSLERWGGMVVQDVAIAESDDAEDELGETSLADTGAAGTEAERPPSTEQPPSTERPNSTERDPDAERPSSGKSTEEVYQRHETVLVDATPPKSFEATSAPTQEDAPTPTKKSPSRPGFFRRTPKKH